MKKLFPIISLFAFTIGCANDPDIRNAGWGMSRTEVMQSEKAVLIAENMIDYGGMNQTNLDANTYYLTYAGEFIGQRIYVEYWFSFRGLYAAQYRFPDIKNKEDYSAYFRTVIDYYNEEYGNAEVLQDGKIHHWKSPRTDVTFSIVSRPIIQFAPHNKKSYSQQLTDAMESIKKYQKFQD
jgi:hypothetical protein